MVDDDNIARLCNLPLAHNDKYLKATCAYHTCVYMHLYVYTYLSDYIASKTSCTLAHGCNTSLPFWKSTQLHQAAQRRGRKGRSVVHVTLILVI